MLVELTPETRGEILAVQPGLSIAVIVVGLMAAEANRPKSRLVRVKAIAKLKARERAREQASKRTKEGACWA